MGQSSYPPTEYDILNTYTEEMERQGTVRVALRMNIDEAMVTAIEKRIGKPLSLESLHRMADRCVANEWLQHGCIGVGRYEHLQLTESGFGVARSRQRQDEARRKRSAMKKLSDYVEEHKGLFVALGFLIALGGFLKTFSWIAK